MILEPIAKTRTRVKDGCTACIAAELIEFDKECSVSDIECCREALWGG